MMNLLIYVLFCLVTRQRNLEREAGGGGGGGGGKAEISQTSYNSK